MTDGWITLKEWQNLTHDATSTIHKRVADGVWIRGYHYSSPEGGYSFVHKERCMAWYEERGKPLPEYRPHDA